MVLQYAFVLGMDWVCCALDVYSYMISDNRFILMQELMILQFYVSVRY
jgi:hypothetical protein